MQADERSSQSASQLPKVASTVEQDEPVQKKRKKDKKVKKEKKSEQTEEEAPSPVKPQRNDLWNDFMEDVEVSEDDVEQMDEAEEETDV